MKNNESITNFLEIFKIKKLNQLQEKVIPYLDKEKNIICAAKTGTGKSLSFIIPILKQINFDQGIQAIILTPTRELAKQIYLIVKEFKKIEKSLKVSHFIGGYDIKKQIIDFEKSPHIIVATPKRLVKIVEKSKNKLSFNFKYFVIDEADMFFDLNFFPDLIFLLNYFKVQEKISLSFFSATIPLQMQNLIKKLNFGKFEMLNDFQNQIKVNHFLIKAERSEKQKMLINLINSSKFNPYILLIFASNKKEVQTVFNLVKNSFPKKKITYFDSSLNPRKRKNILNYINQDKYEIIVASDLLARGMDFLGASHIISYSLPSDLSYYIHRSGRTGRNNREGNSYLFYSNKEENVINKLTNKKKIEFKKMKWNRKINDFI